MQMINIRPTSGVYATYKNLRYEPWTAIAEFVDNSTQSYFNHKEILLQQNKNYKLKIKICYTPDKDGNDYLEIIDNAFGMEYSDFERAIVLDRPPLEKTINSRNEFGMGLKTAACWFGKYWTVISTKLGSENEYTASIDVEKLSRDKDEEVALKTRKVERKEHYTIIRIEKLNKKIIGARTISAITSLLSNIYREDIRNNEVEILFKDKVLTYKDPEIYDEELPDGTRKKWKKNIEFTIDHLGETLHVSGFVALRIPASHKEAGFALIRRGRVIVGGPDCNYRPNEVFGDSGGYAYQRMFGELHMDDWPVTQAKDNFDWHNEGLEEKFIEELKKQTSEYKSKAESIRARCKINTEDTLNEILKEFNQGGAITDASVSKVKNENINQQKVDTIQGSINIYNDANNLEKDDCGVLLQGDRSSVIEFKYSEKKYKFVVVYDDSDPKFTQWLTIKEKEGYDAEICINMRHQFFYPLIGDSKFIKVITKFVLAMVLAEIEAQDCSEDGRVDLSDVRVKMNNILTDIQYASVEEKINE